jgi:hypothetical protein
MTTILSAKYATPVAPDLLLWIAGPRLSARPGLTIANKKPAGESAGGLIVAGACARDLL